MLFELSDTRLPGRKNIKKIPALEVGHYEAYIYHDEPFR